MQCEIISIGDELVIGDVLNTNASWIARQLTECGATVTSVHTIGDNLKLIQQVIKQAIKERDLVITTGGLGPTDDDITKQALTAIFDAELITHEPTLKFIKKKFKKKGIPFSRSNYHQAKVPSNAEILFNKQGTAPGLWFETDNGNLAVLPGIPKEMKALMQAYILPRMEKQTRGFDKLFFKYIQTAGVGESTLSDEVIGPLDHYLSPDISVAWLPSPETNTIRISAKARSRKQAEAKCNDLIQHIYDKAGSVIIGEGKDTGLSETVGHLLVKNNLTISVAESCTGGSLADAITDIPGSSQYFKGGIIAYDNRIKIDKLAVDEEELNASGAVSKPVALHMAQNVARILETDIGVSATGIAGPGGGHKTKPVGTVWIGFWSNNHHFALNPFFTNDRLMNKKRTVAVALETVRRVILGIETMPYGLKTHFFD